MSETPMTPGAALARLQQYRDEKMFRVATYDSGTERTLYRIATTLGAEVVRLTGEVDALRGQLVEACGGTSAVVERLREQQERITELEGLSGPCDCGEGAVHYTAADCPFEQRRAAERADVGKDTRSADESTRAVALAEVVAYLSKKASEYRSTGSKQHALQADAVEQMASKISRGAIRPNNTAVLAERGER